MKKTHSLIALLSYSLMLLFVHAETNALIEVKLFKDWVIKEEVNFGNFNLAIKNTGTAPILLSEDPSDFEWGQLATRPLPHNTEENTEQEREYQMMMWKKTDVIGLLPEETHVYEEGKFLLRPLPFSNEMRFTVSIYLGKGFWLDSGPITINGVAPDSVEQLTTINDNTGSIKNLRKLMLVAYKNERWLYSNLQGSASIFPVCPVSLTNKIRVEPHDDKGLFKIWDGEKSMIYNMYKVTLLEGPDENDVFGKWTRERKQRAEADNAEVRRKKAEAQKP